MANLNKVMLIGRLTKDPELISFANGGRLAKIRFAVNNRVKNQQTGQWEDKAVWLDLKASNRENGRKLADLCEQYLKKGHQVYIEGHLVLEEWDDKDTGQKRSKVVIVIEELQFLEPKSDGASQRSAPAVGTRSAAPSGSSPRPSGGGEYEEQDMPPSGGGNQDEEIPF